MAGASAFPLVSDIIVEALTHLGVYAPGDALGAAEQASAYFTLQGIVDSYAAQALMIYNRTVLGSFTTSAGKNKYTLGPGSGADWATSFLPTTVDLMTFMSGSVELPIAIDTADEWAALGIKSLQSNILTDCWPDYGAGTAQLHTLYLYPTPSQSIPVTLYLLTPISKFTGTSNVLALPPGYQELITFELAIKCSSKFGAQIPAWMPAAYEDLRATVKANNFEPLVAQCDPAIVSTTTRSGGGSIHFYSGN